MSRFKVGDIVVLANPNTKWGRYSIPAEDWDGREFRITHVGRMYEGDQHYTIREVKIQHDCSWGCYESMLELAGPLSPFDQLVRAYITSELK